MRVLFVDSEVRVLEALQRVLLDIEPDWQTTLARSSEQAFAALDQHPHDVTISELRISGIDGAALLARVRELHPRTTRLVLSGHGDQLSGLKAVGVAHQFLAKPCAAETLHRIIARTGQLTQLLGDSRLRAIVGQVGPLPSAEHLHRELEQLLAREHASAPMIAAVIKQDPAMTSKLLQVASSAFFNTSASVADVETAVTRLGFRTLRKLMLGSGVFESAAHRPAALAVSVAALQQRSLAIARTASSMAQLPEDAATAYTAGLLCDVGQLVLASAPHVTQSSTWGARHAEIGAFLLGLWGLPFQIVEAVADHHAPERHSGERLGLQQLVWLAACIVDREQPQAEALHRLGMAELYARSRAAYESRS
jgi:HD-like signal output (HDOD) protein